MSVTDLNRILVRLLCDSATLTVHDGGANSLPQQRREWIHIDPAGGITARHPVTIQIYEESIGECASGVNDGPTLA